MIQFIYKTKQKKKIKTKSDNLAESFEKVYKCVSVSIVQLKVQPKKQPDRLQKMNGHYPQKICHIKCGTLLERNLGILL